MAEKSFSGKGTIQTLEAFQPVIALQGEHNSGFRKIFYERLLDAVANHRVADRPDRYEPRLKKHRRNHFGWLTRPRAEIKRMMAKGVIKI